MKTCKIMLFPNGNTACFTNGQQDTDIQKHGWIAVYLKHLEKHNVDLRRSEILLPNGKQLDVFKADGELRWDIL